MGFVERNITSFITVQNKTSQQIYFHFLLHENFQLTLHNFGMLIANLQSVFMHALVFMQSTT